MSRTVPQYQVENCADTASNLTVGGRDLFWYCGLSKTVANSSYLPLLVLLVAAVGFAAVPLALAWLWARIFSPAKPGPSKNAVYECGLESAGDAWMLFQPSYYIYAIVFLIFDVEAVFLLPFAVAFTHLTAGECIAMLVFVLLLVEGLVWGWSRNVLVEA